jgi:hypothetical protein
MSSSYPAMESNRFPSDKLQELKAMHCDKIRLVKDPDMT